MKKIVVEIQPFDYLQNLEVFIDNNYPLKILQIPIREIPETLCSLFKEHNITEVVLMGPERYTKRIEKETQQKEIEKYTKNILTFEYI